MKYSFRVTKATDADLWAGMRRYYQEWGDKTKVIWVKGHAEKGGKLTDRHEKEKDRADKDAKKAYLHLGTPEYKKGYISQLDSVYGPTIHGMIVVHRMGATILRHLQKEQYLRYWKTRSRAGKWHRNADIEGHAAACRRAHRASPKTMSSGSYKEMNARHMSHDLEHQRDHRYDPSHLATSTEWTANTVDSWVRSEGGEIAEILRQLLAQGEYESVADAVAGSGPLDAQALSDVIRSMSDGQVDVPQKTASVFNLR